MRSGNLNKSLNKDIPEKQLKITGDYQYKALYSKNFLRSNWHSNKLITLSTLLSLNKKSKVLNLGAGSGTFELLFSPKVNKIVSIDYHDSAISFIKKITHQNKINNVGTRLGNITDEKIYKHLGKFDVILMVDVIEHLSEKDIKKLLPQFKTILNKSGVVCIITPNYNSPWVLIEKLMDRYNFSPHLEGTQHLTFFTKEKLNDLFNKAGFESKKITTFNLISFIFPIKFMSSYICRLELLLPIIPGNLIVGLFKQK
jgi:2-polyprenyl-3-methyl-5-hydroxy-6-metoxy-1,4-benzoquinol methylase